MSTAFHDIVRRLAGNVAAGLPDLADTPMKVPAAGYADAEQFERELATIFRRVPLLVALSCDVREPGEFITLTIAGRPLLIVRGEDGVVRAFLNACRHRGARVTEEACGSTRRFTCPYHFWTYDTQGALAGVTGRDSFGEFDATGLVELPCEERVGAVFASLDRDAELDLDGWLGGMLDSLALLRLDDLHPYRVTTMLASPNWKLAADGYVDGYHIGYLHRDSIGTRSITNRNTYDLFGPHVRVGFATKATPTATETPEDSWDLNTLCSIVHYVFPNVSIAGGIGDALMLSKLLPGPTVDRSVTIQHQYFREPVVGDRVAVAEERRRIYEAVVRDEDYATIGAIGDALEGIGDGHFTFGRNESGNQNIHRHIARLTAR